MTSPEHPVPALRLRYSAVSDVGRHRKENQDSGYASEHLLVVADGVGGAAYGDVASATAVHLLRRLDHAPEGERSEQLPALAGAVHRVHDRLAELVEADRELDGTSTTVTVAWFDGSSVAVAHVGDSRAYLLRDGTISQLTKDHTFVQTLIDEGQITEEQSRVHPHRNIIMRAVDGVHDTEPDLFHVELQSGDRLMLCSDGCSGALTDAQIADLLDTTPDAAAFGLVQASLDAGSTDNVTVVVAEVSDAEDAAADDEQSAMSTTGPMLVGAAASQPRRGGMLSRALFRHRHDTGELDPVPAADFDPEELRYAPRPPRRFPKARRALAVLLPLLVVGGLLFGGYSWSQQQYYVAPDGEYVAIYRGVQMDLPGIDLSSVYETESLLVDDLSPFNQAKVNDGIVADSLSHARRIVDDLSAQVDCPPTPSPSPTPTRVPKPTRTPSKSPTKNPSTQAAAATKSTAPSGTRSASPSAEPTASTSSGPSADPCGAG